MIISIHVERRRSCGSGERRGSGVRYCSGERRGSGEWCGPRERRGSGECCRFGCCQLLCKGLNLHLETANVVIGYFVTKSSTTMINAIYSAPCRLSAKLQYSSNSTYFYSESMERIRHICTSSNGIFHKLSQRVAASAFSVGFLRILTAFSRCFAAMEVQEVTEMKAEVDLMS
jgi:hypothetical protein